MLTYRIMQAITNHFYVNIDIAWIHFNSNNVKSIGTLFIHTSMKMTRIHFHPKR